MPLSEEDRKALVDQGLNPDDYQPYEDSLPTPTPTITSPQTSMYGAAGRSALRAIPSGLAALAGVALAPETGGLSFAIPMIAGGAESYLQGAAANKLAEGGNKLAQKYTASEAQDVAEHPYASFAGGLAGGQVAGGLTPSITGLKNAGKGIGSLITGNNLLPIEQKVPLLNSLLGGGIGGGIDIGQQLYQTGKIDPTQAAIATAGGALFNSPNALGRAAGMHPLPTEESFTRQPNTPANTPIDPNTGRVYPPESERILDPARLLEEVNPPNTSTVDPSHLLSETSQPGYASRENRLGDYSGDTGRFRNHTDAEPVNDPAPIGPERQLTNPIGPDRQLTSYSGPSRTIFAGTPLNEGLGYHAPITEPLNDPPVKPPASSADILGGNKFQAPQTGDRLTPDQLTRLTAEANRRGVQVGTPESGRPFNTPEGNRAAGVNIPETRTAIVDPRVATTDTPTHEVLHQTLDDLRNSTNPRDRKLAEQILASGGGEEGIVQHGGIDYARRVLTPGESGVKNYLNDVRVNAKRLIGKMSPEEAGRFLANQAKRRAGFDYDPHVQAGMVNRTVSKDTNLKFQPASIPDRPFGTVVKPTDRPFDPIEARRPSQEDISGKYAKNNPNPLSKVFAGATDKIRYTAKEGKAREVSNYAGTAVEESHRLASRLAGKYGERIKQDFANAKTVTLEDRAKVREYMYDMRHNRSSPLQSWFDSRPDVKELASKVQSALTEFQLEKNSAGMLIQTPGGNGRLAKTDPYYFPDEVSQGVRRVVTGPESISPESQQLRADLVKHLETYNLKEGMTPQVALDTAKMDAHNYIKALGDSTESLDTNKFAALRKAEGPGLPKSWVDPSYDSSINRYFNRATKDLAFHKAIESDPVMRGILDIPDQLGNKKLNYAALPNGTPIDSTTNTVMTSGAARKAIESFNRYLSDTESNVFSASRAVTSGWIGPWSGIRDLTTSFLHDLPYMKISDIPAAIKGAAEYRKYMMDSFESGVNHTKANRNQFTDEAVNKISNNLNYVSDILSKYQGRDAIERTTRAIQFSIGRSISESVLARGNPHEIATWQREFGRGIDLTPHAGNNNVPPKILNELAASWVEKNQGTYDARGIPAGAVKGYLSSFLTLARWGIEKQNTMYKSIILPAKLEGNYIPLLKATLGAVIGGEAIRKLGEKINNRLDNIPDYRELANVKDVPIKEYLFNIASAMNVAGYFGIMSQIAQSMVEKGYGRASNQGLGGLPVMDYLNDTINNNVQDFAQAIQTGEPLSTASKMLVDNILKGSLQSWRIFQENVGQRDNQENKKDLRNIRIYRELEGKNTLADIGSQTKAASITGASGREFDRSNNLQDAASALPGAINVAANTANSPRDFMTNIKDIPENRDQRLPSPSNPEGAQEFMKYKNFIVKTQGQEAWDRLLKSYVDNKVLTQQKRALVGNYIQSNAPIIQKAMTGLVNRQR